MWEQGLLCGHGLSTEDNSLAPGTHLCGAGARMSGRSETGLARCLPWTGDRFLQQRLTAGGITVLFGPPALKTCFLNDLDKSCPTLTNTDNWGLGQWLSKQLRTLAAHAEYPGLVPSTHIVGHNYL